MPITERCRCGRSRNSAPIFSYAATTSQGHRLPDRGNHRGASGGRSMPSGLRGAGPKPFRRCGFRFIRAHWSITRTTRNRVGNATWRGRRSAMRRRRFVFAAAPAGAKNARGRDVSPHSESRKASSCLRCSSGNALYRLVTPAACPPWRSNGVFLAGEREPIVHQTIERPEGPQWGRPDLLLGRRGLRIGRTGIPSPVPTSAAKMAVWMNELARQARRSTLNSAAVDRRICRRRPHPWGRDIAAHPTG